MLIFANIILIVIINNVNLCQHYSYCYYKQYVNLCQHYSYCYYKQC